MCRGVFYLAAGGGKGCAIILKVLAVRFSPWFSSVVVVPVAIVAEEHYSVRKSKNGLGIRVYLNAVLTFPDRMVYDSPLAGWILGVE